MPAAQLDDVVVRFHRHLVLDHVSLAVEPGDHLELRGVNGSGKTTLARVLAGVRPPSSGRRSVAGPVAFVPAALEPPRLRVAAWLDGLRPGRSAGAVESALDTLAFAGTMGNTFEQLSYGNVRKVLLADALTSGAALVVVDEAREGLDEAGIAGLAELVRTACDAGTAVVLADQSSHAAPSGSATFAVVAGRLAAADLDPDLDPDPDEARPAGAPTVPTTVPVAYVGPAARRDELDAAARALGFRPHDIEGTP